METTRQVSGLHKRIAVRDVEGNLLASMTFGLPTQRSPMDGLFESIGEQPGPGKLGGGTVYPDTDDTVRQIQRLKTSTREDAFITAYMNRRVGDTGPYNVLSNSCRDFSDFEFQKIRVEIFQSSIFNRDPDLR